MGTHGRRQDRCTSPPELVSTEQGWLGPFGVRELQTIWNCGALKARKRQAELAEKGDAEKKTRQSWLVISSALSSTESDRLSQKERRE